MIEIAHGDAAGAGVRLHYAVAGEGPVVLLLHGFPDFWWSWRHQMPALTDAGYRVIALDLRGFNESEKPRGAHHYSMRHVVADVAAVLQQLAPGGARIIGHDWGGIVAWLLAAREPALCRGVGILNAPHPAAYRRELRRNPRQVLRSWYVGLNQLPALPELALRAFDFALLRRVLTYAEGGSRMASDGEVQQYITAYARPYALTAALNYYRAAARDLVLRRFPSTPKIEAPTLVVWGERDRYLDARLLDGLHRRAPRITIERIGNAGHFVHWQRPELVNQLIVDWLRQTGDVGQPDVA